MEEPSYFTIKLSHSPEIFFPDCPLLCQHPDEHPIPPLPQLSQWLDLPLILVTFAWHDWRCKLLIYHVVIISHAFYFVNQHSHLLMWWQPTNNREIKIHVYAKWQMSDSSWEILRIENKQINTVQNNLFLCIKLAWNYLFFSWSNEHLTTIKEKT